MLNVLKTLARFQKSCFCGVLALVLSVEQYVTSSGKVNKNSGRQDEPNLDYNMNSPSLRWLKLVEVAKISCSYKSTIGSKERSKLLSGSRGGGFH